MGILDEGIQLTVRAILEGQLYFNNFFTRYCERAEVIAPRYRFVGSNTLYKRIVINLVPATQLM